MAYYEAKIRVTRETTVHSYGETRKEAGEGVIAQVKTWDGYSNPIILSMEEKSKTYGSVMDDLPKYRPVKATPPGKVILSRSEGK